MRLSNLCLLPPVFPVVVRRRKTKQDGCLQYYYNNEAVSEGFVCSLDRMCDAAITANPIPVV